MGLLDSLTTDYSSDIAAINTYMKNTPAKTTAGGKLKSTFSVWYSGLSWLDKQMQSTFQEATNRRNAFNIANTQSEAELNQVRKVIQTGADKETLMGKPKLTDAAGNYPAAKGTTVASANPALLPNGARPTIRLGARGEAVKAWQNIIGVYPDGIFGKDTDAATRKWQSDHGLKVDGIVGTNTWSAALGKDKDVDFETAAVTPVAPSTQKAKDVPTGTVATIASLEQPVPKKAATSSTSSSSKRKKVAAAAKQAEQGAIQATPPPLTAGLMLDKIPTWAKVVAAASGVGLLVAGGVGIVIASRDKRR